METRKTVLKSFPAKRAVLCAIATLCVSVPVQAQESAAPQTSTNGGATAFPSASPGLKLLLAEENDLDDLRSLGDGSDVQAVSLGASLAALQRDAAATVSLERWVRRGGTVFLHTDAAQLFGYITTKARPTTSARAGQLFGRARGALPFGANGLLWSTRRETIRSGGSLQSAFSAPAVRTVFYEMQLGDDLVISHPAAVPLLRVFDIAGDDSAPLYAAAIAPYGRGWAVFTPRRIEQNRADGAAFAQNLLRLAAGTPQVLANSSEMASDAANGTKPRSAAQWLSLPASVLETLSSQASDENFNSAAWLPSLLAFMQEPKAPLQNMPDASGVTAEDNTALYETGLMIERRELEALLRLLNATSAGDTSASTRARALIFVWRARLEVQRDDGRAARTWIDEASGEIPDAAETLFWQGIVTWNEGEELASTARAQAFRVAADAWRAAPAAATLGSATGATRTISLAWAGGATQAARLADATPDYNSQSARNINLTFYSDGNANTSRYFSSETANFDSLSRAFGWRADSLSLVAFVNYNEYSRFRSVLGLTPQNVVFNIPLRANGIPFGNQILFPRGVLGDAVGTTLLTVAPRSALGDNAVLPLDSLVPLSQLWVRAMLNTLLQDGAAPPLWMDLGLRVIADRESSSGARLPFFSTSSVGSQNIGNGISQPRTLRDLWRSNRLLTATQFEGNSLDGENGALVAEQARSLMAFMYRRYGAGRVVETLQRIASGQISDDALSATIGLNQEQFFRTWSRVEFGSR